MLAPLLLVALAAATLLPNHPMGRAPHEDAGVFLYAGSVVRDGGLPYRDVWDHKPPGVHYLSALGLSVGDGGMDGVWLLELVALGVAAVAGHATLSKTFAPRAALFGSATWLLTAPRLFLSDGTFTAFAELFVLPLQFGAFWLFVSGRSPLRVAAIGALGGLAVLLKPTLVALWVAIGLLLAWRAVRGRDARALASLLVGGAMPVAAALGGFAAAGALADLWDQAVAYNFANAATATVAERLDAAVTGFRLTAPTGLVALGALGWLLAIRRRREAAPGTRDLLTVAAIALPFEIALSSGSGRPYHYYYLPWLPSLAILASLVAQTAMSRLERRWGLALLVGALALASVRPAALVGRLLSIGTDGATDEAVAYVLARTAPSDRVLLWGSRAEVNFLTGRRAPTRFVYQYAPLFTVGYAREARLEEMLADLRRSPPALIVDTSASSFATPPLDPAGMRSWTTPEPRYVPPPQVGRVAELVASRYDRVATLPQTGWPVYRLRGAGP